MNRALGLVAAGATFLLAGCVTPAPTTSAYESKAGMTAQAAVSEGSTALVATDAYLHDRMGSSYLETLLTESEDSLGSVQDTFDSIQPPATEGADALRNTLDPLLDEAGSAVTELRIAARRGRSDDLRAAADDLSVVVHQLDAFGKKYAS